MSLSRTEKNCSIARLIVAIAVIALATGTLPVAWAQSAEDVVSWKAVVTPQSAKAGESISLTLTGVIADGWHMYSLTQLPGGPTRTSVWLPTGQPFKVAGPITGTQPETIFDPNFGINTEVHTGRVVYKLPVDVDKSATTGKHDLTAKVRLQLCTQQNCLPPATITTTVAVMVVGAAKSPAAITKIPTAPPIAKTSQTTTSSGGSQPVESVVPSIPSENRQTSSTPVTIPTSPSAHTQSFHSFLWLAAVMGALSLLTPCVFPMIPITVSYFTNHAGASRKSAISTALVYGIGIILTFTALGMLLAVVFGAGGVNQLAANPWVNLLITAIFLGFAFSLFGAYFIQVPPALMNKLDTITRSKEGSGIVGALLMGFTFTLTSFTCTAPFVGTLLVMTAQGNWRWPLAGMLAFSTVFAIPFFILALAPQMMSRLPKAGGWMVQVKVVMGFLEIAAAMKFLSNADLVWRWGIFTRQVVLAVWVGIGLLSVLYVLGYFRMEHDTPVESVGAARVTVAIVFLATTIWLIPGLFGRQLGELESFLPPELSASSAVGETRQNADAGWIMNDYEGALTTAKQQNKFVFVDFTGYTCTNCRWMEANMFPRPEVAKEMKKFTRVRLYTDGDGPLFERQQKMQQEKVGTVALPYYAILTSDGNVVATFPGLTRNASEFMAFLSTDKQKN